MDKKYYSIDLNNVESKHLKNFLKENKIYAESSFYNSNTTHFEILLDNEGVEIVNNFLNAYDAFKNAQDCLFYGYGKKFWNTCSITDQEILNKIWNAAIEKMSNF